MNTYSVKDMDMHPQDADDGTAHYHVTNGAEPDADHLLTMQLPTSHQANRVLFILFSLNLLNFIDRYLPSSTKELIKNDLHLSDTQTSIPLTSFMLVYMTTAP